MHIFKGVFPLVRSLFAILMKPLAASCQAGDTEAKLDPTSPQMYREQPNVLEDLPVSVTGRIAMIEPMALLFC